MISFSSALKRQSQSLLRASQSRAFGSFPNHRDTAENREDTPFEFTEESYEAI